MGRCVALRVAAAPAAGAALLAALAATAGAQTRIDIEPSVGASEVFSDNVDFVPSGTRSGFTTQITPRIRVAATGGRLTGGAAYQLGLRIEHFSGGSTKLDHDAFLNGAYDITERWKLTAREEFRFSPDPTESLAFVTPEGEIFRRFQDAARRPGVDVLDIRVLRQRQDELRNRLAVGTTYDLTPRWSVGADAHWLLVDSESAFLGEDSTTIGAPPTTGYRLTPIDRVTLSAGVDATDFQRRPDATLVRGEAGWERRLTETLTLNATGGVVRVATTDNAAPDRTEWTARAALFSRLADGNWRLALSRDVGAGGNTGDVSTRLAAEAALGQRLGASVTGDITARFLRTESLRGFGSEDNVFEGTASLSYQFIRWAALQAAYRYRRDDPVGSGPAVQENSALVGLELRWPFRELPGIRQNL